MATPAPARFRLPRAARMQASGEFAAARTHGQRLVRGCLIANWMTLAADQRAKLGVVVSRRVGPAVIRSRARRLLRETYRRHQHALRQPVALVLVARPSIKGKALVQVERDFLAVMRQGRLLADLT